MIEVATAAAMRDLGERLASVCMVGDVIALEGELGAGKTTFTQGFAVGLGVTEPITSPTFVIARVHSGTRTDLVHVDAYRVGTRAELDDLDLPVERSVTVVEWGGDVVDLLAADPLVVHLVRRDDDAREVRITASVAWQSRLAPLGLHGDPS